MSLKNFAQFMNEGRDEEAPIARPDHATQIALLRSAATEYWTPTAFKKGNIVRGRKAFAAGSLQHWDQPHIILAVLDSPHTIYADPKTIGYCTAAKNLTMVVALVGDADQDGFTPVLRYYADPVEWELYPAGELPADKRYDA